MRYSDEEAINYIIALENPHKVGWDKSKKVWKTPKGKGFDNNQIAYGLDIRQENNPLVYNYLKDKGRLNDPWLTDQEARSLAMQTYRQKKDSVTKAIEIAGGNVSQRGYNILSGMAWHGHPMKSVLSPDSITGKAFRKAIKLGDQDFDLVFDTYYQYGSNAKQFAERIKADKAFRPQSNAETYLMEQGSKNIAFIKPDWSKSKAEIPNPYMPHREPPTEYPIDTAKRNPNKYLDPWNGAGSPSYAVDIPKFNSVQETDQLSRQQLWDMFNDSNAYAPSFAPFKVSNSHNKGKDVNSKKLPRFDEGSPYVVGQYNIYPSALGTTNWSVEAPNVNVWSNPGALEAYTKKQDEFRRKYLFGAGSAPVEPGLELTFPEFDLITLLRGVPSTAKSKAVNQYDIPTVQGSVWRDIPENPSPRMQYAIDKYNNPTSTGTYNPNTGKYIFNTLQDPNTQIGFDDVVNFYKSPEWRLRYLTEESGATIKDAELLRDKMLDNMSNVNIVENTPYIIQKQGSKYRYLDGTATGVHNKDLGISTLEGSSPETTVHELLHSSVKNGEVEAHSKKLAGISTDEYMNIVDEQRAKGMSGIIDMFKRGISINDKKSIEMYINSDDAVSGVKQLVKTFGKDKTIDLLQHLYSTMAIGSAGTALYTQAKDVSQDDLYNAMEYFGILPLKTIAEGVGSYNEGKIYIKPSKRGTFTAAAKKHGLSVQAFASLVLNNPGKYSTAMRKKAQFAKNASKWKH